MRVQLNRYSTIRIVLYKPQCLAPPLLTVLPAQLAYTKGSVVLATDWQTYDSDDANRVGTADSQYRQYRNA